MAWMAVVGRALWYQQTVDELTDAEIEAFIDEYGGDLTPAERMELSEQLREGTGADSGVTIELWSVDWMSVLAFSLLLAAVAAVLIWIYHSIQRPRLHLTISTKTGKPTATWQSIVRYAILTPIVIYVWWTLLSIILMFAAPERSAEAMAIAAAVIIGAGRFLAHISFEVSHELTKIVPLTAISLMLISGTALTEERFFEIVTEFEQFASQIDGIALFLIIWDVIITSLWFWQQRLRWFSDRPGSVRRKAAGLFSPVATGFNAVRFFGRPRWAQQEVRPDFEYLKRSSPDVPANR